MLDDVIGQERAKQILKILTQGFYRRGTLPPVGLFGASGRGKTHLSNAWTGELNAESIYINGTAVKDSLVFRAFFKEATANTTKHYVVFIDECHALPKKVQENLLSVLEQPAILCTVAPKEMGNVRCVDGVHFIEKGDVMREALPPNLSFILATTDPAQLSGTILDRLRKIHLVPYTIDDKIAIAVNHLSEQNVNPALEVVEGIAQRSRSVRHLKEELCNMFADIKILHGEDDETSLEIMDDILGIDCDGASELDRDYLMYLCENTTVGLDTMAGKLQVDKKEVATNIEPFLLEKGWITIESRGRKLTLAGKVKIHGIGGDDSVESL